MQWEGIGRDGCVSGALCWAGHGFVFVVVWGVSLLRCLFFLLAGLVLCTTRVLMD